MSLDTLGVGIDRTTTVSSQKINENDEKAMEDLFREIFVLVSTGGGGSGAAVASSDSASAEVKEEGDNDKVVMKCGSVENTKEEKK